MPSPIFDRRLLPLLLPLLLSLLLAACAAPPKADGPPPDLVGPALVLFYTDN